MKKLLFTSLVIAIIGCGNMKAQQKLPFLQVESMSDASAPIGRESMTMTADSTMLIGVATSPEGIKVQIDVLPGMMQRRTIHDGLIVYLDITGKKKEKYYVSFPNKGFTAGMERQGEFENPETADGRPNARPNPVDLGMDIAQLSAEPSTFYQDKEEKMMSLDNARLSQEGDCLVYICYVPFDNLGKKKEKNGKYNICVTTKERERPQRPSGDSPQMGNPGGGPGGPGGPGGMRGGGPGGPGGMRGGGPGGPGRGFDGGMSEGNRTPKAEKTWYVLTNDL